MKPLKWGRYRSWLIMVPWMVPFLYAFMFIRVSDNEWLSAVVIIAASIASHVAWNFSYVANATLISIVGKTPEDKATLASSRATWNNIGGLLFSYMGLPCPNLCTGGHNYHGRFEYVCVQSMEKVVELLLKITEKFEGYCTQVGIF